MLLLARSAATTTGNCSKLISVLCYFVDVYDRRRKIYIGIKDLRISLKVVDDHAQSHK